jgi:hypothetical protein
MLTPALIAEVSTYVGEGLEVGVTLVGESCAVHADDCGHNTVTYTPAVLINFGHDVSGICLTASEAFELMKALAAGLDRIEAAS